MLKFTLTVQEKKNTDNCTVKIEKPKNMEKATKNELSVGNAVYETLTEALQKLQNK